MTSNADWLAALARRLLHRYTFETMVSPAIADLQCEAAHGRFRIQVRHYIAICAVLVCALARDFRLDLRTAFDADALPHVWRRAAIWYLGVAALMTAAALRAPHTGHGALARSSPSL